MSAPKKHPRIQLVERVGNRFARRVTRGVVVHVRPAKTAIQIEVRAKNGFHGWITLPHSVRDRIAQQNWF